MSTEGPLRQAPPQLPNQQPSAAWLAASVEEALEPELPIIRLPSSLLGALGRLPLVRCAACRIIR